jgi:tetratricopeptide (TPR) repeat protein
MDDVLAQVIDGKYDMNAAKQKTDAITEAQARTKELNSKIDKAQRLDKWDEVIAGLDELIKVDSERSTVHLQRKFGILLLRKQDYAAAYAMKDALLADTGISEDAKVLNELAWSIVRPDSGVPKKDQNLDFAMTFAQKANDVTNNENSLFLDTLARVHWEKGDHAKAIELQEKAVKSAEKEGLSDAQKGLLKATLDKFKKDDAKKGE